ncbi:hypothetical protein JMJ35_008854 [Cladonia borealis]|uniref:Uncharacterized protein n=1 Tax=Cladonia borealis TaxID=184061 RepID=A0AA39QSY8_9LECA|nr:hypothetical protein JMJ35_008854 [Cladonia borealis]
MAISKAESDIFANKTNILLAKSQRQIASWLPPRTAKDEPSVQPEEELEDGEGDFLVAPEVLGLGGTIPKDGEAKMEATSIDKLRKQLLGKDHAKRHADGKGREAQNRSKSGPLHVGSKPHTMRREDDDSEDDEGRSSLGKSKHRVHKMEEGVDTGVISLMQSDNAMLDQPVSPPRPSKRASNYLDEVLADRSRKKQKSKRKKHKATAESESNV